MKLTKFRDKLQNPNRKISNFGENMVQRYLELVSLHFDMGETKVPEYIKEEINNMVELLKDGEDKKFFLNIFGSLKN